MNILGGAGLNRYDIAEHAVGLAVLTMAQSMSVKSMMSTFSNARRYPRGQHCDGRKRGEEKAVCVDVCCSEEDTIIRDE
jgi:hypothetical protein